MCEKFGCVLSGFKDEPPQPKTNYVSIPAGSDIDITAALGAVAFSDGEHQFDLSFIGATAYDMVQQFKSWINGKRNTYRLTWDSGYTFTGRCTVADVERISDNCEKVTLKIRHSPFKTRRDSATITGHPTATYSLEGSAQYSNVTIKLEQHATVTVGGNTYSLDAGTHTISNVLTDDTDVTVTLDDWWYYLDGTDLIVNPNYYTLSGSNVDFDNTEFVISGTNISVPNAYKQNVVISYTRKDL